MVGTGRQAPGKRLDGATLRPSGRSWLVGPLGAPRATESLLCRTDAAFVKSRYDSTAEELQLRLARATLGDLPGHLPGRDVYSQTLLGNTDTNGLKGAEANGTEDRITWDATRPCTGGAGR